MRWVREARVGGGRRAWLLLVACSVALGGCATRRISVPEGPGSPFPDFAAVHQRLAMACQGVRTFTAEIGLRGRTGERRLSGRLVAGFARPDAMRLTAVASFGPPVFILTSQRGQAMLLLPRGEQFVEGESAEDILGALTGVKLNPADLQAILTGCVVPEPRPTAGRLYGDGWAAIDVDGGATLYLRRAGDWRLRVARRGQWQLEYLEWQGAFPQSIRLQSSASSVDVEMTATLAQLEANTDIDPAAFVLQVPPGARRVSLDELGSGGPLGEPE